MPPPAPPPPPWAARALSSNTPLTRVASVLSPELFGATPPMGALEARIATLEQQVALLIAQMAQLTPRKQWATVEATAAPRGSRRPMASALSTDLMSQLKRSSSFQRRAAAYAGEQDI